MAYYGTREYYLEELQQAETQSELIKRGSEVKTCEMIQSANFDTEEIKRIAKAIEYAESSVIYKKTELEKYDKEHPAEKSQEV